MNSRKPSLKIAQIANISERVPPKKYGGIERVISALTEELVERGHRVTLFATNDSQTSAKLISVYPRSLREAKIKDPYGLNEPRLLHIATAYRMYDQFDIIHDHNSLLSLPTAQFIKKPVIITLHTPVTSSNKRLLETVIAPYYVAISQAQTAHAPNIQISDVIYNGLSMEHYPFSGHHDSYLLYVGRISMEKGTHHAIDVAQALDMPLIIAAKLDNVDLQYFREYIEPRLYNKEIQWIGEVNEDERNKLMSKAFCLLHPVYFREPFGLTMIEAMACGCPVIAFPKGSIPEIVINGKNGFIVNDVEEMVEAVEKIVSIDRNVCRQHVLENFSSKRMTDKYEDLYYRILSGEVQK